MKGRIKFKIQILGGLIKVESQITAEVGEKCDDGLGNPFDDIPIVSHLDPSDGDSKVDCYTNPQIIFNFPKEPFKYEIMDDNDPKKTIIRGFSYTLKTYKFTYKDPETKKIVTIETSAPKYAKDGYSCFLEPKDILPGVTEISYEIRTQGREHYMDGYLISKNIKETFPDQVEKGVFVTDSFPDYIAMKDLVYAIPGYRQRYFLIKEQPQGEIFMNKMPCDQLFKKSDKDYPDIEYVYKARFTELATNKVYDVNCNCSNNKVSYPIPAELYYSRIYKLEIIRQSKSIKDEVAQSQSKENWTKIGDWNDGGILDLNFKENEKGGGKGNKIGDIKLPPHNPNPKLPNLDLNSNEKAPEKMLAMEVYDREFVKSITSAKVAEKILWTNYFKTSKYKTVNEKASKLSPHSKVFSTEYAFPQAHFEGMGGHLNPNDLVLEVPVVLMKTEEGFDQFDVKGYFWSEYGNKEQPEDADYNIHPPIFKLKPTSSSYWLEDKYNAQSNESIFRVPDEEDFKYKMKIFDPELPPTEQEVEYTEYNTGDLRKYIFWPDDNNWVPYMPTYFNLEENETEGIHRKFWRGDRFAQLAVFESLEKYAEDEFNTPFMINDFKNIQKVKPIPQDFGHGKVKQEFVPAEWYSYQIHQHVDFGNLHVVEPEGPLESIDITKEMAKAPQPGKPGNINNFTLGEKPKNNLNPLLQNQMNMGGMNLSADPTKYIAIIEYSEWMAKRDHTRMTNKILYEFREEICVGCGKNLYKLGITKDAFDPKNPNIGQDPKGGELDYGIFKYSFKYLPMRAWLLHFNPYTVRQSEAFRFKLGESEMYYDLPTYNKNASWPSTWVN